MSVRTTADEQLDSAKKDIRTAIQSISDIIINQCWGWDEYSGESQENMREVLNDLLKVKTKLG